MTDVTYRLERGEWFIDGQEDDAGPFRPIPGRAARRQAGKGDEKPARSRITRQARKSRTGGWK